MTDLPYPEVRSTEHRWFSVHLESPSRDSVYAEPFDRFVVANLRHIEGSALGRAPRFFVRYSVPRPHLRVRVRVPSAMTDQAAIEALELPEARRLGLFADAVLSPYEPEYSRYGGDDAMPFAETAFCASSDLVLSRLMGLGDRPRSGKIGAGILSSYATLFAAYRTRDMIGCVSGWLRDGWVRILAVESGRYHQLFDATLDGQIDRIAMYLEEADGSLRRGEGAGDGSREFHATWFTVVRAYHRLAASGQLRFFDARSVTGGEARFRLIPAMLHMTHNRMGLTRLEEAYVAHALAAACERVASTPQGLVESNA